MNIMRLIQNLTIKHNFLKRPLKRRNFTLILGQKFGFLKRPKKRRIFTQFLGFFWPDINTEKFKNITF